MTSDKILEVIKHAPCQGAELCPIYLKLPAENIVELKFTLESYEHLGILRTLNSDKGEVVILAIEDTLEILQAVLNDIGPGLKMREIPPPESMKQDWLLAGDDTSRQ